MQMCQYDLQLFAEMTDSYVIVYVYEADGSPLGMQYLDLTSTDSEWEIYWFEKNLQGDVIAVYDDSGTKHLKYTYDAWGNASLSYYSAGIYSNADLNPFRYRGYYYDVNLGLYYLQSRYYDAKIGRFINADGYVSTGTGLLGYNMFAYCNNNPVNHSDPTGEWLVATVVGALVGGFGGMVSAIISGDSVAAGILTGALSGAAIGYVCDLVAGSIASAGALTPLYLVGGAVAVGIIGAAGNALNQFANYQIDKNNNLIDDESNFSEYADYTSIVMSGVVYGATSLASIGIGATVNSAFSGAGNVLDDFAKNIADVITGGAVNLFSTCIDWIVQEVAKWNGN